MGVGEIQSGRSGGLRVATRRGFDEGEQREQDRAAAGGLVLVLCKDTISRRPYININ